MKTMKTMKHSVRRAAAFLTAWVLSVSLIAGGVMPIRARAAYAFDPGRTAAEQLEAIFTTVELMDASISELQAAMQSGRLTSEKLTRMYIDRIRAYDEAAKLNSVISINPSALEDAAALDAERAPGEDMGPLYGIPVIVKDNYDVRGMATAAGAIVLKDNIADEDSFAVRKLRDAGAVIIGKANMSEFAVSAVNSHSTLGGDVHNAYDVTKVPGGSSGGTGVAVTSNFAAAGLGTDTGGSIRNPASFSNLYGIRPSKGLTSISGVVPLSAQRDTTGPIARSAEDLALILETMAGTDADDDFTLEADADALRGEGYSAFLSADGLKGKRIGFLQSSFSFHYHEAPEEGEEGEAVDIDHIQDETIRQMVKKAKANLAKAGAVFVDLSEVLPDSEIFEMYDAANDATFEYDVNKYLNAHPACPYRTFRDIILSQVLGDPGTDTNYINEFFDYYLKNSDKMADSFESTPDPYTEDVNGYMRGPSWASALELRKTVSDILKEHDVDAVMYLCFFETPADENAGEDQDYGINESSYAWVFGPALGMPEINLPMGFGEKTDSYYSEMPLGLSLFADFGGERTLLEIAAAYEKQAGGHIRRQPPTSPALPDEDLNAYLKALMEAAHSIDYDAYSAVPSGKVYLMNSACDRAGAVDRRDPAAVYAAAQELAEAYDDVMAALEAAGKKRTAFADVPRDQNGEEITAANLEGVTAVRIVLEDVPQELRKVTLCASFYDEEGVFLSESTRECSVLRSQVNALLPAAGEDGAAEMRVFALGEDGRPICEACQAA